MPDIVTMLISIALLIFVIGLAFSFMGRQEKRYVKGAGRLGKKTVRGTFRIITKPLRRKRRHRRQ